jgi:hypothetical protein
MNSWEAWASEQKAPKYAKSAEDCSLAATLSCVSAIFESAQSGSPAEGVRAARQRCTPGDRAEPQSRLIVVYPHYAKNPRLPPFHSLW